MKRNDLVLRLQYEVLVDRMMVVHVTTISIAEAASEFCLHNSVTLVLLLELCESP